MARNLQCGKGTWVSRRDLHSSPIPAKLFSAILVQSVARRRAIREYSLWKIQAFSNLFGWFGGPVDVQTLEGNGHASVDQMLQNIMELDASRNTTKYRDTQRAVALPYSLAGLYGFCWICDRSEQPAK